MARFLTVLCGLWLGITGCSEKAANDTSAVDVANAETLELLSQFEQVCKQSNLCARFISALSSRDYDAAFQMLESEHRKSWTQERFSKDWDTAREQAVYGWGPKAISTFYGRSQEGLYEQVTYQLEQDWRSECLVYLTARQVGGEMQLTQVGIRIPDDDAPEKVKELTDRFVNFVLAEDFDAAAELFVPELQTTHTTGDLKSIAPLLGPTKAATRRQYFRNCANGVWGNGVQLTRVKDPMTYLVIMMSDETDPPRIANVSLKGRL